MHNQDKQDKPLHSRKSPLLRTTAMPKDTNSNGDIFGGWLMSQMDIGTAILAKEIAQGRVVTVAVDAMTFHRPVAVGDVVCCYGECIYIGNSSLKIHVEVWIKKISAPPYSLRQKVTEGTFTFVAIDENGKPRPIPKQNNPEYEAAMQDIAYYQQASQIN